MIPVGHRTSPRRLWLLRPRTILLAIGLAILAAFAADRTWTRGNGLVAGELTAVAPIVQSRLKQLFVRCLDHVARGQRLAEFENEATVEAAAQQLQQLQLQLTESRAEIDIAQGQAEAARKLIDAQSSLRDQLAVVLKAMDQLMKSGFVAILQREQVKANLAQAEAETSAAEFVYQTKKSDQKKAELMVSALAGSDLKLQEFSRAQRAFLHDGAERWRHNGMHCPSWRGDRGEVTDFPAVQSRRRLRCRIF